MPLRPVVLTVCLLTGAILLWRALIGGDRFTTDVRRGEVASVDGALRKRAVHLSAAQGASPRPEYYFDVAGLTSQVMWESAFEAAPRAGYVRVFYLPRSHKAVNLERLPDPRPGRPPLRRCRNRLKAPCGADIPGQGKSR
jgi:hypothetical protein